MNKYLWAFLLPAASLLNAQSIYTPLEKSGFERLTSYTDLIAFVEEIASSYPDIKLEYIAESVEGRKIPALKISSSGFNNNNPKLKILIFAQQHGNEQSGKEGALYLLKKFAIGNLAYLLERIDLILIPQMNPDGSEKNDRRNGRNIDLNRNHLMLSEPETIGLNKIFNEYLPEMTLDVHEYFPFTDDWKNYGYIKFWDEQFGTTTNPNVSEKIREFSNKAFIPFADDFLTGRGFTFNNYILGGPPNEKRMRHSTFDINDGRQSMGILNTFSFILEGLNGEDAFLHNIKRRTEGQAAAMEAFLQFAYENADKIRELVKEERSRLINSAEGEMVTIQMEHSKGDESLQFMLRSLYSDKDSLITVDEYHNSFERKLEVEKPSGYLIPKTNAAIERWLNNHNISFNDYKIEQNDEVVKYKIIRMDSVFLEETMIGNPILETKVINDIDAADYFFVPVNQLHSNMIVLALEPQSMLGLNVYKEFEQLIIVGADYPILKLFRRKD